MTCMERRNGAWPKLALEREGRRLCYCHLWPVGGLFEPAPDRTRIPGCPRFTLLRRGYRTVSASFTGEGAHVLEVRTLDGQCVLRASGRGPKTYSLAHLAQKSIYEIHGRDKGGEFSRRLLVP